MSSTPGNSMGVGKSRCISCGEVGGGHKGDCFAIAEQASKVPFPVCVQHIDTVNHPPHYNAGKIECIEFLEDQQLGFHLGNAVKYIVRAGKKDRAKAVEDLEKAIWYIRRHVAVLKGNPPRPNEMPQERAP